MRRFLSVWLPHWSIERYLQKRPERDLQVTGLRNLELGKNAGQAPNRQQGGDPFALVTNGPHGMLITAVNFAASEAGVLAGTSLTDAKALCPPLLAEHAVPEIDEAALEQLTLWCLQFSPMVTVHSPDGFALDISGCDHLFGGEQAMLALMAQKIRNFRLSARLAIADTIGTAWAAARFGKNRLEIVEEGRSRVFLSPLPLAALRLDGPLVSRLQKLGLRHVRALLDAPAAPLTSRFGAGLINRLHQATGEVPEVFGSLILPPIYHLRYAFIEPVVQLTAVEAALSILAGRMMNDLKQARKGARQLEVRLFRVDGHVERLVVGTSRLCNEADHMVLLFQENLSHLRDDLDMGFGFELMTMSAFDVEGADEDQKSWDGSGNETTSSQDLDRLLDRFGNRFGFDRVARFIPEESHIPERAFRKVAANTAKRKEQTWPEEVSKGMARPFLLFNPPELVTVLAEVPDGPPLRFKWRRQLYQITRSDGPERLSPEWWKKMPEGGSMQTRDYYRIEDSAGYRFWLFRDGLYNRDGDKPQWYLHGVFP